MLPGRRGLGSSQDILSSLSDGYSEEVWERNLLQPTRVNLVRSRAVPSVTVSLAETSLIGCSELLELKCQCSQLRSCD